MDKCFTNLFDAAAAAVADRTIRSGKLPSPWATWTTFSLILQRRRQLWGCKVVRERLSTNRNFRGIVPGLPEWEFIFHGGGCRLTHRVTGETLETETGPGLDFFFWLRNLESWRTPDPATRRMVELHPNLKSLRITLTDLKEAGVIESMGEPIHRFLLSAKAVKYSRAVIAFLGLLEGEPNRTRLSRVVGDVFGQEPAGQVRQDRLARVLTHLAGEPLACEALFALDDLRPDDFPNRLKEALFRRPFGCLNVVAMDLVSMGNDPAWCETVHSLWSELCNDEGLAPAPLWTRSAEFLLRHGQFVEEVLAALPIAPRWNRGEAALLALEYAPDHDLAARLFRLTLMESPPCEAEAAAAALAILDIPWSREILLSVLRDSEDIGVTGVARAGLLECRDPAAQEAVNQWEKAHPAGPNSSPPISDPVTGVQYEITRLHGRVTRIRRKLFSNGGGGTT